jgi:hypothetical protein
LLPVSPSSPCAGLLLRRNLTAGDAPVTPWTPHHRHQVPCVLAHPRHQVPRPDSP